jgi:hypothetical protein
MTEHRLPAALDDRRQRCMLHCEGQERAATRKKRACVRNGTALWTRNFLARIIRVD